MNKELTLSLTEISHLANSISSSAQVVKDWYKRAWRNALISCVVHSHWAGEEVFFHRFFKVFHDVFVSLYRLNCLVFLAEFQESREVILLHFVFSRVFLFSFKGKRPPLTTKIVPRKSKVSKSLVLSSLCYIVWKLASIQETACFKS